MRQVYEKLIEELILDIGKYGALEVIYGGSEERPVTLKHDRTVSLKNLLTSYKHLAEIYPEAQSTVDIQQLRDQL